MTDGDAVALGKGNLAETTTTITDTPGYVSDEDTGFLVRVVSVGDSHNIAFEAAVVQDQTPGTIGVFAVAATGVFGRGAEAGVHGRADYSGAVGVLADTGAQNATALKAVGPVVIEGAVTLNGETFTEIPKISSGVVTLPAHTTTAVVTGSFPSGSLAFVTPQQAVRAWLAARVENGNVVVEVDAPLPTALTISWLVIG
jgi:hypothetical protein